MPSRRSQDLIRFGISQGHGGTTLLEGARAFAHALSVELARTVRTFVTDDYTALLAAILDGGVEVAWMPPFVHLSATVRGGALVAVSERGGAFTYRSALVVRTDSQYRSVADLRGARVAWSDPSSAAGHVFPRMFLLQNGLDPARDCASETFFGSPRAVCAAVADGRADVGACFVSEPAARDAARLMADVQRVFPPAAWRIRVIGISEAIPSDGIVVGGHVDPELRGRIRDAVLRFHTFPDGRAALDKLLFADSLVPVNDAVSRVIEELRARTPA